MQTTAHYYCHPVPGNITNFFHTPSVEYIAILPSLMEYRTAYDIACDFFSCIANIIKLSATDYIITPGPPGAPDTPTRTFCLVTRSPLEDATKRAVLSIAKSLRPYTDNSDLDQNGRTYLRVQFDLTQIKLFSGSDNLTKLNNIIRGDLTSYLWVLIKSSLVDITPELLEELTDTTVDSWLHVTKYGDYVAVLAPTEDPCRLTDGHPQIHVIKKTDTSCVWTILPKGFPNEYQPGRGRIESYFGSSPPHFIYYISPSADPTHVRPEHYVYMPEPLRTTLFIHQTLRPIATFATPNANIAQNLPTTKTPRRNAKGLQLPTSSPPHDEQDNNAPPSPPIQHNLPPAPPMRRYQEPPQQDRLDQSGQRFHERLSNLENFVKSLPPIRDTFQDLYNRLDTLPDQLSAELHSTNDITNNRINTLHDAVISMHDDLTQLRTTMSTHLNYLYFFNNANPHDHLPPLPPVEDEYQHVFATGKTEFSPFKVPNTNILPMDSLPSSAIRNLLAPTPHYTLINLFTQVPTDPPLNPLSVAASFLPAATWNKISITLSRNELKTAKEAVYTRRTITQDSSFKISTIAQTCNSITDFFDTFNRDRPTITTKYTSIISQHSNNHPIYPSTSLLPQFPTRMVLAQISPVPPPHNKLIDKYRPLETTPHASSSSLTVNHTTPTNPLLPPNQIVTLALNNNTRTFHSPFATNCTINDLIIIFFSPHQPPKKIRTSIHHRPIPLDTKLTHLHSTVSTINILLPIIGGTKNNSAPLTSTPNPTPPENAYKGPKLSKPLKRNGYTLRIATFNCNGCLRNNPHDRHQLLWNFVHTKKIDVLFLIDHRTTPHSLQLIKNHGSKFLNLDIRLITTDITLLHKPSQHSAPAYNFHATVGGCAILTFGSLAHVTFPTSFQDPSGAGTFIGAKIQPQSSLPPVFLNAIYLFPPSQGPTTLNSRINTYLTSNNHNMTPCKWQRTIIAQLLQEQYDSNPNCAQIVGGDFNHRDWNNLNHPITRTFITDLQLNNAAYDAVYAAKGDVPSPITFPQNGSWIDHFLHIGRVDILDFRDYKTDLVTTYSDHAPYSNDFYIQLPTTHYNIPRNLNLQAQSCLRATHLKKHDTLSIARYQALCNKHYPTLRPPPHLTTPLQHETYYDQLCSSLIKFAKRATKITITTFKHTFPRWSPDLAFLYKLIKLLMKIKTHLLIRIPHVPQSLLTQTNIKITKFIHDNY